MDLFAVGNALQYQSQSTGSSFAFDLPLSGYKLAKLNVKDNPHVFSSSGGNAGLATAVCGRRLGLNVTVVVPETTKPLMLDKIRAEGAEVGSACFVCVYVCVFWCMYT